VKAEIIKDSLTFPKVCKHYVKRVKGLNASALELMAYLSVFGKELKNVIDFLSRIDEAFNKLSFELERYETQNMPKRGSFEKAMNAISSKYNGIKSANLERVKRLSEEESSRIDEAYHCLKERCYWSAVVNAAVGLESRLFEILKGKNKATLEGIKSNMRFTLGALADAYLNNKSDFGRCIPDRHEHLLKLVNSFRIVSAHPKQFEVDQVTADAVFNLVLKFLLDRECELPKKRGRKTKS
jgi:hypothetical protein